MFQYLDRGNKEFISYGDFCEMAEERRRNLDAFDYSSQQKVQQEMKDRKSWVASYLDDSNIYDLEKMSKNVIQNRNIKNRSFNSKKGSVPLHLL